MLVPELRERWVNRDFDDLLLFWPKPTKVRRELRDILEFLDEKNIYLGSLLALAVLLHEAVLRQDRERLEAVLKAWTAAVRYAANPGNEVCGLVMEDVSEHLAQFGRDVYEICGPHPPIEMAAKFGRHSDANRPLGTNRGQ